MAPKARSRIVYSVLIAATITVGLILHARTIPMPPMCRKYLGDALWATNVFWMFGFVFNRLSTASVALLAFSFASLIECSQIYHAPWIDSIRATTPGALVLGQTFNWPDFLAYAAGVVVGTIAEKAVFRRENAPLAT